MAGAGVWYGGCLSRGVRGGGVLLLKGHPLHVLQIFLQFGAEDNALFEVDFPKSDFILP